MSSFASSILGWLRPSRPNKRSLMCQGTARQIARRLVAALDLQDDYHATVVERHLVMVIHALRASGEPVTKYNMSRFMLRSSLEELLHRLQSAGTESEWLYLYLYDFGPSVSRLITQTYVHLAAQLSSPITNALPTLEIKDINGYLSRFQVVEVPSEHGGMRRQAARAIAGLLVDLLVDVCFVVAWASVVLTCAVVFWVAFDQLQLAGLVGRPAISVEQCLGLGLSVTYLFNVLTGRTDAFADRVVNRITWHL